MSESGGFKSLSERFNRGNMYFATQDPPVEITDIDEVFNYGNQCLYDRSDEVDRFGRCYMDKMFIWLCTIVHMYVDAVVSPVIAFKSLSCKKEGDKYLARVQHDDVDLEMELLALVRHFECLLNIPLQPRNEHEAAMVAERPSRWDKDNMYFLTNDPPVEITTVADLYAYTNQRLYAVDDAVDEFGRGYLDKLFIRLCNVVYYRVTYNMEDVAFKFLSCKKVGDDYIARVWYDDEDVEMELREMVRHFERLRNLRTVAPIIIDPETGKEALYTRFGWNANNMFFLTRDVAEGQLYEITSHEEVVRHSKQRLLDTRDDIDVFGRNYFDKMFIRLCLTIVHFLEKASFISLSCRKEGDKYIVRVEFTDETVEKELIEMESYCVAKGRQVQDARRGND